MSTPPGRAGRDEGTSLRGGRRDGFSIPDRPTTTIRPAFGIGASATIAAWTDTEQTSGVFEAGEFAIEVSVDGAWNDTRQMTFDATGMHPGAVVHAPVQIRTTPNTSVDGELTLTGEGATGGADLAGALEHRVVTVDPVAGGRPSCEPGDFADPSAFVVGSPESWVPLAGPTESVATQPLGAAGGMVAYCFEVRLAEDAPNSAQGQTAEQTWTWDATSVTG
ncbi:SipW-dependent-type signal peptide-containing protein [Brachybacterium fresconis]|uniref:Ribosomally synthesized peptide with SipW-like signal peptide n=1 Tax=Brachybacterium fresconis TaxID=173363 RepID=A0ABS4YK64_9MICO|nr:putative ribosomally synthesized peptide with SipW-like signal peptide [Brachybacterium fresconis]